MNSDKARHVLFLLPFFLVVAVVLALPTNNDPHEAMRSAERPIKQRLVVVIVDSLRPELVEDDTHMPFLHSLSTPELTFPVRTCQANFTLPCIQTLLEGRESPFVAGLHNFTGAAGSSTSLPSAASAAGLGVVMISDHTLPSLYAQYAKSSFDAQDIKGKHLDRDLWAIRKAGEELQSEDTDVLLLHVIGTDKAAHYKNPGSEGYRDHFRAVDQALEEFFKTSINPETDFVFVTGDHGHGPKGHHTRSSIVLFHGQGFERLLSEISVDDLQQTDLLYFMAYATLTGVPLHTDARFFDIPRTSSNPHSKQFIALHDSIAPGASISKAFEAEKQRKKDTRYYPALALLPLLVLGSAVAAWMLRFGTSQYPEHWRYFALGGVASAFLLIRVENPILGVVLAFLLAMAWLVYAKKNDVMRETGIAFFLVAGAAFTGAFAEQWSDFFHTRGGFRPHSLVFYGGLILAGLSLASALWKNVRLGPEAAMMFCVCVLPSGVYYYHFGQNFYMGFMLSSAALILYSLVKSSWRAELVGHLHNWPRRALALALVLGVVYPLLQESGGWEWKFFPLAWMSKWGAAIWAFYCALFALVALMCRSTKQRIVMASIWLGAPLFTILVAHLPEVRWVAATAMTVTAGAYLRLRGQIRDEALAAFLLAACLHVGWMQLDGFFINHVDFQFGLALFGQFAQEVYTFALTLPLTMLKYTLAFAPVVVLARLLLGSERFSSVILFVCAIGFLKIMALFAHILFGAGFQDAKLFEIAISDLLFVMSMTLMIPFYGAIVSLSDRVMTTR